MLVIYERFLGANSGIMTPAPVLFSAAKPIFKIFCAVQKFTLKIKKKLTPSFPYTISPLVREEGKNNLGMSET